MSTKKLKSLAGLIPSKLDHLYNDIREYAKAESEIIYVYPYIESSVEIPRGRNASQFGYTSSSKFNDHPKSIRHAYKARTRTYKGADRRKRMQTAKRKRSNKLIGLGVEGVISTRLWAVRLEGNSKPCEETFESKVEAIAFAHELMAEGRGKRIVLGG